MPHNEPTVGTEAMPQASRPAPAGERQQPRMVEVGREKEKPRKEVPYVNNPHVRFLVWRIGRIEACNESRGVRMVAGEPYEDFSALPEPADITWGDLGYRGSHDLLHGQLTDEASLSGLAARINKAIDAVMESYVEEMSAEA